MTNPARERADGWRPVTTDWIAAWTAGFIAHRDGVPNDDSAAIMGRMQADFDCSGSELARKVIEGVITEGQARKALRRA